MQACVSISSLTYARTEHRNHWLGFHDSQPELTNHKRLRINVGGIRFETFESTIERFPETLLGSSEKRTKFYDPAKDEYHFDRDKHAFDAILFYYQSKGILCRPEDVPSEIFNEELKFYEIKDRRFPVLEEVLKSTEPSRESKNELTLREKCWELLENPESSTCARYLSFLSISVITLSLVTYCLETVPRLKARNMTSDQPLGTHDHWFIMECVWITWFSLELVLRLMLAPNRLRFVVSPYGLIDMVAVLPFYITLFVQSGSNATSFSVLRILRIGRCLRLFKLSRYNSSTTIIAAAIRDCQDKLRALALFIFITVILFSSFIYYAEEFGEGESQFESIPDTFYYTIITMVTVGYGDYVPRTVAGRILGSFCAYSGVIVLYCFPTPIIVVRFVQLYKEHVINEMKKSGKDTRVRKFSEDVFKKPSLK